MPFFIDEVPTDLGLDAAAWDYDTMRALLRCPEAASPREFQPGAPHDIDLA